MHGLGDGADLASAPAAARTSRSQPRFGPDAFTGFASGWNHARSSPTYANGVVFMGTADGILWARDAKSGAALWDSNSAGLAVARESAPARSDPLRARRDGRLGLCRRVGERLAVRVESATGRDVVGAAGSGCDARGASPDGARPPPGAEDLTISRSTDEPGRRGRMARRAHSSAPFCALLRRASQPAAPADERIVSMNLPQMSDLPKIIQGGMGAGVSNWRLAQRGFAARPARRRLRDGARPDPRAPPARWRPRRPHAPRRSTRFPFPKMAQRIWETYFVPGGKAEDEPYKPRSRCPRKRIRGTLGTVHRREFRRSRSRARRARQSRRHQLSREDPDAASAVDLRRDARRRQLHPDGRRHPDQDPRRARSLAQPRTRDVPAARHRRRRRRRQRR